MRPRRRGEVTHAVGVLEQGRLQLLLDDLARVGSVPLARLALQVSRGETRSLVGGFPLVLHRARRAVRRADAPNSCREWKRPAASHVDTVGRPLTTARTAECALSRAERATLVTLPGTCPRARPPRASRDKRRVHRSDSGGAGATSRVVCGACIVVIEVGPAARA